MWCHGMLWSYSLFSDRVLVERTQCQEGVDEERDEEWWIARSIENIGYFIGVDSAGGYGELCHLGLWRGVGCESGRVGV